MKEGYSMSKRYVYKGINTPYLVYRDGRVYSELSNKFINPFISKNGYYNIHLRINNKQITRGIHQMVAETYIPNPESKKTVNHEDGDKSNNWDWNLKWMSQGENNQHSYDIGLKKAPSGSDVHFAKYTTKQVQQACLEIEKDEKSLYDIEKMTGIPHKILCGIRSRDIWKDVSKDYKFPDDREIASRIGLDHKTNKKMKKLIKQGKSNKEVYEILGIERTKVISRAMSAVRLIHKRKMKKVQRPSKSPISIPSNDNYIVPLDEIDPDYETIRFGYELGRK